MPMTARCCSAAVNVDRVYQDRAHESVGERRQLRRPEPPDLAMFVGSGHSSVFP